MKNLKNISKKLSKISKKVYIVGGWFGDYYLGVKFNGDIDLATDANPLEVANSLDVLKEVGKK